MHRYAKIGIVGAFVAAGTLLALSLLGSKPETITGNIGAQLNPYLSITSGEVLLVMENSERPIADGELLTPPLRLKTVENTRAHIQFPDGSEIRLDAQTEIEVASTTYNTVDGSLFVSAQLRAGRVWSSIIGLVTPASAWEVETSNVVATVRGSAFSTAIRPDGSTSLWGSEHPISVEIIDPATGLRSGSGGTVTEDEYIVIGTATATAIVRGEVEFKPLPLTDEILNDPWFTENEAADAAIRAWLQYQISGENNTPEARAQRYELLKARDTESNASHKTSEEPFEETATEPEPMPEVPGTPVAQPRTGVTDTSSSAAVPRATSITIIPSVPLLKGIDEGTSVSLSLRATLSDGSTKMITEGVTYDLAGPIGFVRGSLFTAQLDSSVVEYGSYRGGLVASWTDPVTGATLYAKTELFEVRTKNTTLMERG